MHKVLDVFALAVVFCTLVVIKRRAFSRICGQDDESVAKGCDFGCGVGVEVVMSRLEHGGWSLGMTSTRALWTKVQRNDSFKTRT